MEFELTSQREAYINSRGKIVLNACPGSGKTTCVVYKLALLQKECFDSFGSHAGIACLSFTNRAKEEIQEKYREFKGEQLRYPHTVSTIDSFINHFITLPFYNLIDKQCKRPKIIDSDDVIDNALKITYKDKKGDLVEGIKYPFNTFKDRTGGALYRSYKPSEIWIELGGSFSFKGKVPDDSKVDNVVFQKYGAALFEWKQKNGLITGLDSAYLALNILNCHERIGVWLAFRFPYILIDEAQDNSAIQHAIFEKLNLHGLKNIELIGDPYQSLYEWRDAKPQLFVDKFGDATWNTLPLSQNRRSNQRIIDCFSILRLTSDEKITSKDVTDGKIPITIYKYNDTNAPQIVTDFEAKCLVNNFNKAQIVVRGNVLKDKMLGKAGSISPWKDSLPERMLEIKHLFESQNIKEAVNKLRSVVLNLSNTGLDYHKLKDLEKESKKDYLFNAKLYSLLFTIPPQNLSLSEWSKECSEILKEFNSTCDTYFEFKFKMTGFKMVDLKKEMVSKYFNKSSSSKSNIPISTIHQIKGATLDAILCFFNETNHKENITFTDFDTPVSMPTEKQRLIYVACSRPSQFLAMAFPAKISDTDLKNKFGNDIDIIVL